MAGTDSAGQIGGDNGLAFEDSGVSGFPWQGISVLKVELGFNPAKRRLLLRGG
jgi:hypothetical protein